MADRKKLIELLKDSPSLDAVDDDGYAMGADHLIANGVTFATDNNVGSKWIPVTERLPDKSATLVAVADAKYYTPVRVVQTNAIMEHMFWGKSMGFFAHGVLFTHWTPLPEPPKEG